MTLLDRMGTIKIKYWCRYGTRSPEEKKWLDPLIEEYTYIYAKSNKLMKKSDDYMSSGEYLKVLDYRDKCFKTFDKSFAILDTIRERFPELMPDDDSNELLLFFKGIYDLDKVGDVDRHMIIEVCRSLKGQAERMNIRLGELVKVMHEIALKDSMILESKRRVEDKRMDKEAYEADIMFVTINKIIDYLEQLEKCKTDTRFSAMHRYDL